MKARINAGHAPPPDLRRVLTVPGPSGHARQLAAPSRDGCWTPTILAAHWAPVPVLAALAALVMVMHGDQWLADRVYAGQGHEWALRSSFMAEQVLHIGGRDLSAAAWLGVLAVWLVARVRPGLARWRSPLAGLLVATSMGCAAVAWIKSWSNMDCPWDLTRYGGAYEYIGLFSLRPAGMPRASCFPAGHASAGYAWVALYFFLLTTRPRWRWLGLAVGVSLGLVFGITQQLRGAHFLSHDLWTAAICWVSALGAYLWFQGQGRGGGSADLTLSDDETGIPPRAATSWRRPGDSK